MTKAIRALPNINKLPPSNTGYSMFLLMIVLTPKQPDIRTNPLLPVIQQSLLLVYVLNMKFPISALIILAGSLFVDLASSASLGRDLVALDERQNSCSGCLPASGCQFLNRCKAVACCRVSVCKECERGLQSLEAITSLFSPRYRTYGNFHLAMPHLCSFRGST